jgi:anti-anti-sigma factor
VGQLGTIQVEMHSATAAIVALRGEHDLESQQRVAAALTSAGACQTVLADLSDCTFADSSIITVLLRARRTLAERGGTLELVVGPEARSIRRTLEIMGVAAILRVHDSAAAAFAAIGDGPGSAVLRRAA